MRTRIPAVTSGEPLDPGMPADLTDGSARPPGWLPVAAAAVFLAVLGSCDSDPVVEPEPSLEIVPDSVTLTHIGAQFAFTVRGGEAVRWNSLDLAVFTVDADGTVTARGNGTAQVRAWTPESSDHALVRVQQLADVLETFGEGQRAAAGLSLIEPVGVRVLDAGGAPVSGMAVRFEVDLGGGRVEFAEVLSDSTGLAGVEWTLGPEPGPQTLVVSAEGVASVQIAATALELDEAVASFEVPSGGDQWAWSGRALPEPVVVQARDEGGRPLRGATVRFQPDAGGRADPGTAVSDSAGVASTAWTLGTAPGSQTLTVSAGGNARVQVMATARDPNEAVASVEAISGEDQWAVAGHALPDSVAVLVTDETGRPVWGATVTFEPEVGSGRVDPGIATTDSLGLVAAVWTLGSGLGNQRMGVAAGGTTLTFEATAVSNEGVCNRTPAVSGEIAASAGLGSCAEVTAHDLGRLTWLGLGTKGIRKLRSGDFDGLVSLRGVILTHNQLEELPPDLFKGLSSLSKLWLGFNPLGELPPDIFAGLTNLSELVLSAAGLTMLPPGVFHDLASLERLYLDDNSLESLPPGVFAALSELKVLYLSENKLMELPPGLLQPMRRLELLFAGRNHLARVPEGVFKGLSRLKTLDLTTNWIRELSPRAFEGLSSLEGIRLETNRLRSLPPRLFAGLSSLEYVRLYGNPGIPFPVHAYLVRADTSDLLAPGPARVEFRVPSGAPFAFRVPLSVQRGSVSRGFLSVEVGDTASLAVDVTPAGAGAVHISLGAPPSPPEGFNEFRVVAGEPIALFAEAGNRPPVIRSVIPAHRLQVSGPAAEVALAEHFDDPNGDSLVYEVESDDPRVAVARIEGGTLWLDPGAVDTTEVEVTATDPDGLRAVQRFQTWVIPAPDPSTFNIELIFGPGFTEEARAEIRRAAARWMEVVVGDLPDVPVDGEGPETCTNRAPTPRLTGVVDDLLIYMHLRPGDGRSIGLATVCTRREESGLAIIGANWFSGVFHSSPYSSTFYETALHEIGHVLGIGYWKIEDLHTDPHFPGPLAVAAFDASGGEGYVGAKVPVEDQTTLGGSGKWIHWRRRVMPDDVMSIGSGKLVTVITAQALADLGHVVDVTKADPYKLPGQAQRYVGGLAADSEAAVTESMADDLIRGPVEVVDEEGKVVRVIRP